MYRLQDIDIYILLVLHKYSYNETHPNTRIQQTDFCLEETLNLKLYTAISV